MSDSNPRWEYWTLYVDSLSNVGDELNELGLAGWELVAAYKNSFFLKRKLK